LGVDTTLPALNPASQPVAASTGTYLTHSHILEHEDTDMMQRYVVED
jgi:FtsP/CotA-like multicopper oxidase with cupredoxin domain